MSPIYVPSDPHTSSLHTSKGTEEAREKEEGKGKRETEESGCSSLVSS